MLIKLIRKITIHSIIASHSIFSLLFLVLSFLAASFILFMLECEFLALIFIVVYVGAIAVLFVRCRGRLYVLVREKLINS